MLESILLRPTSSHNRHLDRDCVYHIYNRVAHSVRFLEEEEKNDLLRRFRRVSEFCGIPLLSWCIMTNHFHLLVYLPPADKLSIEEVRRRFTLLQPDELEAFNEGFMLGRAPNTISERICNVGMLMKIVKENFTLAYNDRTGHSGTMWDGPYRFKKIPMNVENLSRSGAYQNLNPLRAHMTDAYDSYAWTSFTAASRGDPVALAGLEFIFGGFENRTNVSDTSVQAEHTSAERTNVSDTSVQATHISDDRTNVSDTSVQAEHTSAERTNVSDTSVRDDASLLEAMSQKMDEMSAKWRIAEAESVWRKRVSRKMEQGKDPVISEALLAQVEEQKNRILSDDFRTELSNLMGRVAKEDELSVVRAMSLDPQAKTPDIAKMIGISSSRVKRISLLLQNLGVIRREGTRRSSIWKLFLDVDAKSAA